MLELRQKRMHSSTQKQEQAPVIVVDDTSKSSNVSTPTMWIPELGLSTYDRDVLLSNGWLTDSIVNAAQTLLRKSNPIISGLQDVTLGLTMSFEVEPGEFVQILHNGAGHWITISTVGTNHPGVQVFDSLYTTCPLECKAQIVAMLATEHSSLQLKHMNVQMQTGEDDCGVFAIAFATAVVYAKQPGGLSFNQPKMREHLYKCFQSKEIAMFPVKQIRHSKLSVKYIEEVPVYCKCRMPELPGCNWIECSKCKGWYHIGTCVSVSKKHLQLGCPRYCHQCL